MAAPPPEDAADLFAPAPLRLADAENNPEAGGFLLFACRTMIAQHGLTGAAADRAAALVLTSFRLWSYGDFAGGRWTLSFAESTEHPLFFAMERASGNVFILDDAPAEPPAANLFEYRGAPVVATEAALYAFREADDDFVRLRATRRAAYAVDSAGGSPETLVCAEEGPGGALTLSRFGDLAEAPLATAAYPGAPWPPYPEWRRAGPPLNLALGPGGAVCVLAERAAALGEPTELRIFGRDFAPRACRRGGDARWPASSLAAVRGDPRRPGRVFCASWVPGGALVPWELGFGAPRLPAD